MTTTSTVTRIQQAFERDASNLDQLKVWIDELSRIGGPSVPDNVSALRERILGKLDDTASRVLNDSSALFNRVSLEEIDKTLQQRERLAKRIQELNSHVSDRGSKRLAEAEGQLNAILKMLTLSSEDLAPRSFTLPVTPQVLSQEPIKTRSEGVLIACAALSNLSQIAQAPAIATSLSSQYPSFRSFHHFLASFPLLQWESIAPFNRATDSFGLIVANLEVFAYHASGDNSTCVDPQGSRSVSKFPYSVHFNSQTLRDTFLSQRIKSGAQFISLSLCANPFNPLETDPVRQALKEIFNGARIGDKEVLRTTHDHLIHSHPDLANRLHGRLYELCLDHNRSHPSPIAINHVDFGRVALLDEEGFSAPVNCKLQAIRDLL